MVLRVVAQNMPEHSNSRLFGDCDETHSQIAARLHNLVSIERVAAALRVLDNLIFLVTRKAAKGRNGTHRTFHPELAYNIAKWERSGAEPTPQEVAVWDERLYGLGYKPQHSGVEAQRSGVSPAPPIEVPIASTYKTPRGVGNSKKDDELQNPRTKIRQLEAKLSYLEDAQRDVSNPFKAQQARFEWLDVREKLRGIKSS